MRRVYRGLLKKRSSDKKENLFTKINSFSTIILVLITGVYAYFTYQLTETATDQMLLMAEPNLDLASEFLIQIKDLRFNFILSNQSPVDLKNIQLSSKYYTHIIDNDLKEYLLYQGIKSLTSDTTIIELKANSLTPVYINYNRSGFLNDKTKSSFVIGTISDPIEIPSNKINKFYNRTFAEYVINYQRQLDGKAFTKKFYFIIALASDSLDARLIRSTKEEILESNRETARMIEMLKSK